MIAKSFRFTEEQLDFLRRVGKAKDRSDNYVLRLILDHHMKKGNKDE